jgi:cystathionine beta-lyase/cystathionine gamma-synthase
MSDFSFLPGGPEGDMQELSFILNELGEDRDQYFRAIAPPIIQTSNFAFKRVEDLYKVFQDEYSDHVYTRGLNPTTDILRAKLAALDGAEDCLVFNSGSSAIFASIFSTVKAGDHIVSVEKPYTWARNVFEQVLSRFNVTTTYVDGRDVNNFKNAIQSNTVLIYLESPNSWDFVLQDLRAIAELAKAHRITTIIDNSYCSPLYQQPIKLGIDMVLQSATKYIGGHSDVVAGVLTGSKAMMKQIFTNELMSMGNGISPFNAWLLIRGLRTLPARLDRITRTTREMIPFLKKQPAIEEVIFPLDPSFPQYELASRQMSGACGLVTIVLKVHSHRDICRFCESLNHFLIAVSWGGHESLVIPYCAGMKPESFDGGIREHRMVRLYFGLEDPAYLMADIQKALQQLSL